MSDSGMTMNRTIIVGRRTSNRGMAACHLGFMINGSWLRVQDSGQFRVHGSLT